MATSTTAGSTFTPIRPGALTFVGATVTHDAAHKKAVSDSAADLDEGAAFQPRSRAGPLASTSGRERSRAQQGLELHHSRGSSVQPVSPTIQLPNHSSRRFELDTLQRRGSVRDRRSAASNFTSNLATCGVGVNVTSDHDPTLRRKTSYYCREFAVGSTEGGFAPSSVASVTNDHQ